MLDMGDHAPGTPASKIIGAPLDRDQMSNVLQTTARMPDADKLALMAGFSRFVVEMIQQVFESVIQGRERLQVNATEEEDQDATILVQTELNKKRRISQTRTKFTLLQGALEIEPARAADRADALRRRLEERYQGTSAGRCGTRKYKKGMQCWSG